MTSPSWIGLFARILGGIAVVGYPLAIYAGLRWWSARAVAALVLAMVIPTTLSKLRRVRGAARVDVLSAPLGVAVLVAATLASGDGRFILAMPVLINALLLLTFARTLRPQSTGVGQSTGCGQSAGSGQSTVPGQPQRQSMIERYARMIDPELRPDEVAHCRQVTWVWCGFFVLNGSVAGALALWASPAMWALYTGLISYGLMGGLFAVEFIVRKARFRRYGSGLHDRVFARIFPPS